MSVPTTTLTQKIKKVIAREAETKFVAKNMLNSVTFNSAITSTAELYSCVPPLALGNPSSKKVGQSIQPRSLHLKGAVCLSPDAVTADITVVMYVFTTKKYKNYDALVANFVMTDMLDDGQSSTVNFDGTIARSLYPPEKQQIRLLSKKLFVLRKGHGLQNGGTDDGVGGASTIHRFDVKIKCPQNLLFDDSVGEVYPTNFAPVVGFGYYHNDATIPDVINRAITVNAQSHLYYDDM